MTDREIKFEKLLSSLEGVRNTLDMIEREIPFVSARTKWTPVLTRGFEGKPKMDEQAAVFFQNLGLGRGVDVTLSKPFHNKTAFQVKRVKYDKLIGTEEGGLLEEFTDIVLSSTEASVKYDASLDIMEALGRQGAVLGVPLTTMSVPLKFTTSGEFSRSESSARVVLGVRILNRTVSFQQTMDTVPAVYNPLVIDPRSLNHDFVPPQRDTEEETFEETLTKWIREYYEHTKKEGGKLTKEAKMTGIPTKPEESSEGEAVTEGVSKKTNLDDIADDILETLCEAYTRTTGVTHYVSSIKLGAELYKTMDQRAYKNIFKSNVSVNVLNIFTVGDETDQSGGLVDKTKVQNTYATKVIGKITEVRKPKVAPGVQKQDKDGDKKGDGDKDSDKDSDKDEPKVGLVVNPRKSYRVDPRDEAVIGYELRSVASLIVKDERLAEKMALAARRYIDEKRREKVGPYYIASHDMESGKTIYLMKGEGSTLTTTTEQCEAAPFKIVPDKDDEKEFHIVYEAKDGEGVDTPTFRYYLTTRHRFSGVHSELPSLEQHPKESNSTFALHSQLHEWINTQEKLEEWISKGESFLINCENRKWAKDGYFALERKGGQKSHKFNPVCVRYTNENDDILLAFKLIRCPPPYRKKSPQQEQQQAANLMLQ